MKQLPTPLEILRDPIVRTTLARAWGQSKPGVEGGHEEGGFVVLDPDESLSVEPWPAGERGSIAVPEHAGCVFKGMAIVATFHTHPNTGPDYLQQPGESDKRGVRDDENLKGPIYVGEFVISNEMVYLITPSGTIRELSKRIELLGT